jgi:hypothetical protein
MTDPTIAQLNVLTNHVITIFNDLISLKKEMMAGDVHNLVLILQNQEKCSLKEAVRLTVAMHDEEVRKFVELAATVHTSWKDPHDAKLTPDRVEPYIDVLRCWMRSNMDWSSFSERYHPRAS